MTAKDRTIDAAFNAAITVIQEALGVEDGGWAGLYFADREHLILSLLGDYYDSEIDTMGAVDPDAHLIP
jgi:hypothetical protein